MRNALAAPSPFILQQNGKCECKKNLCGCCADMDIEKLNFNHTGKLQNYTGSGKFLIFNL